jgi:hypothetical protein
MHKFAMVADADSETNYELALVEQPPGAHFELVSASTTALPTPDELRLAHLAFDDENRIVPPAFGYTPPDAVVLTYYELWEESTWEKPSFESRSALDFETAIVTPSFMSTELEIKIYLDERKEFHRSLGIVAPEIGKLIMRNRREVTLAEAVRAGWQAFLPKHVKEQLVQT